MTHGRRPHEFTKKMIAHGFDHTDEEHRQQFKERGT